MIEGLLHCNAVTEDGPLHIKIYQWGTAFSEELHWVAQIDANAAGTLIDTAIVFQLSR